MDNLVYPRQRVLPHRKPLCDLTNSVSGDASRPRDKHHPHPQPHLKPHPKPETRHTICSPSSTRSATSVASSDPQENEIQRSAAQFARATGTPSSSATTRYRRIRTGHSKTIFKLADHKKSDKGMVVVPSASSCPPLVKTKAGNTSNTRKDAVHILGTRKSGTHSGPFKTKKRTRQVTDKDDDDDSTDFALSQDFIEKQRAYFAEVDAFELTEEVVSDSDLE